MIAFRKMHGLGNDFVVLNRLAQPLEDNLSSLARRVCDRKYGVGADGLLLTVPGDTVSVRMRVFNADGSEAAMCGNGLRCVVEALRLDGLLAPGATTIEVGARTVSAELRGDGLVQVDMGPVKFDRASIGIDGDPCEPYLRQSLRFRNQVFQGSAAQVGNPNLVFFVSSVTEVDLSALGPHFSRLPQFAHGANVHFVEVLGPGNVKARTWELGAGETLACGSGACAIAAIGCHLGLTGRAVTVELPGGKLEIYAREDGHVIMTGPASHVFTGSIAL